MNIPKAQTMLKALRLRGLSQQAIGKSMGVSQCFISGLCSGKRQSVRLEHGIKLYELYARHVLGGEPRIMLRRKRPAASG